MGDAGAGWDSRMVVTVLLSGMKAELTHSTEQCKTPKDEGTDPIWAEDCSKKSKTKELSEKLHKAQKLLPEDITIHSVFKNKRSP